MVGIVLAVVYTELVAVVDVWGELCVGFGEFEIFAGLLHVGSFVGYPTLEVHNKSYLAVWLVLSNQHFLVVLPRTAYVETFHFLFRSRILQDIIFPWKISSPRGSYPTVVLVPVTG